MVDCPRCGDTVEQLQSLPEGTLEQRVLERRDDDERRGAVCQWCRHEVIEG